MPGKYTRVNIIISRSEWCDLAIRASTFKGSGLKSTIPELICLHMVNKTIHDSETNLLSFWADMSILVCTFGYCSFKSAIMIFAYSMKGVADTYILSPRIRVAQVAGT